MSNRNDAIDALSDMGQDIFEASYTSGQRALYVERSGTISSDEYVGSYHERQSVYFGESDAPLRLGTVGLGSCGYNGSEADYRELDPIPAEQAAQLRTGDYYGECSDTWHADSEVEYDIVKPYGRLYWDGNAWCQLGAVADWDRVQEVHPCQDWIDAVAALPYGWFADETEVQP